MACRTLVPWNALLCMAAIRFHVAAAGNGTQLTPLPTMFGESWNSSCTSPGGSNGITGPRWSYGDSVIEDGIRKPHLSFSTKAGWCCIARIEPWFTERSVILIWSLARTCFVHCACVNLQSLIPWIFNPMELLLLASLTFIAVKCLPVHLQLCRSTRGAIKLQQGMAKLSHEKDTYLQALSCCFVPGVVLLSRGAALLRLGWGALTQAQHYQHYLAHTTAVECPMHAHNPVTLILTGLSVILQQLLRTDRKWAQSMLKSCRASCSVPGMSAANMAGAGVPTPTPVNRQTAEMARSLSMSADIANALQVHGRSATSILTIFAPALPRSGDLGQIKVTFSRLSPLETDHPWALWTGHSPAEATPTRSRSGSRSRSRSPGEPAQASGPDSGTVITNDAANRLLRLYRRGDCAP